jgi:hypothetical protein
MIPLINGTAYSWSQIELRLFNNLVAGITSVSYSDKREITNNYGAGQYPVSRSMGKYEAEAKLTLEMVEVVALQRAITGGRLQDIPEFDIVVSYLPESGIIISDTIHNVRFMSNKRDGKSGEGKGIEVELDLVCSHITFGV